MIDKQLPLIYIAISPDLLRELRLDAHLDRLAQAARVELWPGPGQPEAGAVLAALERAEVLVTGWGTPSLVNALEAWAPELSPLRLVAHTAGSLKFLLPRSALERGLLVTHANESLAESVAEFTLGAMIAMRRQMILSAFRFHSGQPPMPFEIMRELPGSTVGIIGASAIGRRVMHLLRPWNVNLLLADPYCHGDMAAVYGARKVELDELFSQSDIVSLHAPVTEETIGMIRGEHFAAMKDGALFINTARGRLIDADALLAELLRGRIYALLDVTDPTEPLPPDSPFFQLPNCVVLPHMAANSIEARTRQGRYAAEEILRFLAGQPIQFQVQPQRWDTMA
jgi:phosphoglycerate dehydrogenase-like enzyme